MISVVDPESVGANEKQGQRTMAFLAVLQPYDTQDSNLAANILHLPLQNSPMWPVHRFRSDISFNSATVSVSDLEGQIGSRTVPRRSPSYTENIGPPRELFLIFSFLPISFLFFSFL